MKKPIHNEDGTLTDYGKSIGALPIQQVEIPALDILVDINDNLKKLVELESKDDEPIELSVTLEII